METLRDRVVSLLKRSPADQYSIYRQLEGVSISEITKTIAELWNKKIIHVAKYRKSGRMGLDIPVYSLSPTKPTSLDLHGLIAGVTSERLAEYDFVARNLPPPLKKAIILDIGSGASELARAIRDFGNMWQVHCIDLEPGSDSEMDARSTGFRDGAFDQVICISTIEHIGLACNISDENGDTRAMKEIFRILKKGGSAIITVPYGKDRIKSHHRVYDRKSLSRLVRFFFVANKVFYLYDAGKWIRCSQKAADGANSQIPLYFHSAVCVCLLLRKK